MGSSVKQNRLYSFYKAVITVLCFAVCFYLFLVSFTGTFRLISGIGSVRVLFLNPVVILLIAFAAVLAAGVYITRTGKLNGLFERLDDEQSFKRIMTALKIAVFIECLVLSAAALGMRQRVDQYSVQYSAYGLSWDVTEVLTPPRHLGVYPNNVGIVFAIYLMSFITGHYNNAVIMLIFSSMIPFIYSDLAEIGEKFGMSRKSQILVMICGLLFIPLQTKSTFVYGDAPGLFFAVKAIKYASDIAFKKSTRKSVAAVIAFTAVAYVLKNNYLIFAIAIVLCLTAELLRQRRFRELFIPLAVIAAMLLLNTGLKLAVGAVLGGQVSSGASKFSWIAMGMQENAGIFNGYNDATYYETGFDVNAQSEMAKNEIATRLNEFLSDPNQAIGFYIRKVMVQWSDPTYNAFEFAGRNVYAADNASPFLWYASNPEVTRVAASFLKVFQVLMLSGSAVAAGRELRKKTGTPALFLLTAFIGGYFFHLIWEAGPSYAMPYAVILIPTGISGMILLIKKLSSVKAKELMKAKIGVSVSGVAVFIAGTAVFLLAAAGIGTIRQMLADGRSEYRTYFSETLPRTRDAVDEGMFYLKPAIEDYDGQGIEIELVRYAGKYRLKVNADGVDEEIYLTNENGRIKADWCTYDEAQVFVIVKNHNGTYSLFQDTDGTLTMDPDSGLSVGELIDYTYTFDDSEYRDFISEHPEMTWYLVPV